MLSRGTPLVSALSLVLLVAGGAGVACEKLSLPAQEGDAAGDAVDGGADAGGDAVHDAADGATAPEGGEDAATYGIPDRDPTDKVFGFAVIPDTQQEVLSDANAARYYTGRVSWLNANWAAEDLRFVAHTGDASNWGEVDTLQYDRISAAMRSFDDLGRPWAIAPGNHDTAAVGVGGSAADPATTRTTVRDTTQFNERFGPSRLAALVETYEANKSDNAVHAFGAGGLNWLVVTLELWPRTEIVAWAKAVVERHPRHNVIFVTHMHLNGNGTISGSNGGYGANSPQYVFDNLYSKYENVRFVFSGHVGDSAFLTSTGEKGNKIFQLLGCFHRNNDNPVRLVEVNTETNTFSTKVYGPDSETEYENTSYSATDAAWIRP